jgi:hypothetical protein
MASISLPRLDGSAHTNEGTDSTAIPIIEAQTIAAPTLGK